MIDGRAAPETKSVTLQSTFHQTAQLLGRKWHLTILAHLLEHGQAGFGELTRATAISSKVPSETLTDLTEKGFVDRKVLSERPKRVSYSLTERGRSFGGVIRQVRRWHTDQYEVVTCDRCDTALVDERTCPYCDERYCAAHRLPEGHDCAGLENAVVLYHQPGPNRGAP